MPINSIRVEGENLFAMLFEVVELAAVKGPPEQGDDAQHDHGRQRNEQVDDVHGAFSVTAAGS